MSKLLTANEIGGRALRAIGSFPITESAPDPEALREALAWLDMLLAQEVGTERLFAAVEPGTLSVAITNGTQAYDLYASLGSSLPDDGIEYIVDAFVEDANSNRNPVEVVSQQKFEDVCKSDESGPIRWIAIDQEEAPTLRIFPIPAATDSNSYTLKLIVQRFAPNVAPAGVTGDQPQTVAHKFGQAWQRWLVLQLAHDLGSGPVFKIEESRLNRLLGSATLAKQRLLAFQNRTHETTPPVCEPWGLS